MDKSHKQRLLIGFTGAPIILAAAWFGDGWFLAVVALIAMFSQYELLKMVHYPPRVLMVLTLIVTPMCLLAMFFTRFDIVFMILLFAAIFTNFSLLFYKSSEFIKMSFVGLGSVIYPGLSLGAMILLRNIEINTDPQIDIGRNIVITMIIAVYSTDIFAYYVGKLLGRHPLFSSVSPKKTVEGAVGGFIFSGIAMIILWLIDFIPVFHVFDYIAIAICAGIFGQLGDLVESKIKREIGVKDSSNILLTHGGFLDRFDSLAVVAPLFWIFVYIKFFV
ncbi:MAG: phosphatidate cytidylyltransferase [Candidatus Marinimicrobia bacterium]|nr:phosphatidate cytidylyltransferase [Candidatus Neomarinimicrobiota bacterium]